MKLPPKKTVDRMVERAKKLWGLQDWDVTWEYGDIEEEGLSDPSGWTEKKAHITLSKDIARKVDRKYLYRLVCHELGHAVLMPPWRGVTDWIDDKTMIPPKSRERRVFEEQYNTRENEVIDHLIVRCFGL